MKHKVFIELDEPHMLDKLIQGWDTAGVCEVMIRESRAIYVRSFEGSPSDFLAQFDAVEEGYLISLAIVPSMQVIKQCFSVTERVIVIPDEPLRNIFRPGRSP